MGFGPFYTSQKRRWTCKGPSQNASEGIPLTRQGTGRMGGKYPKITMQHKLVWGRGIVFIGGEAPLLTRELSKTAITKLTICLYWSSLPCSCFTSKLGVTLTATSISLPYLLAVGPSFARPAQHDKIHHYCHWYFSSPGRIVERNTPDQPTHTYTHSQL